MISWTFVVLVAVLSILTFVLLNWHLIFPVVLPPVDEVSFGNSNSAQLSEVRPFKIEVGAHVLQELNESLRQTRFFHSLKDSQFT